MGGVVYLVSHPKSGGDVLLRVLEAAQRYIACHADFVAPPDPHMPPGQDVRQDLHRSFNDLQAAVRDMNRRLGQDGGASLLNPLLTDTDRGPVLTVMR